MVALKFLPTWVFLLPLASKEYNYDQPQNWFLDFPLCGGFKQSPISIHTNKVIEADLPPLEFFNYDVPFQSPLKAINTGLTVDIEVGRTEAGQNPSLTGGGVDDEYELVGFHYHWGAKHREGTEHAIDGRKYDLELHMVHRNKKFATTEEALVHPFGFLVLGVLFKSIRHDVNGTGMNAISDILPQLSKYDSEANLDKSFTAGSLLSLVDTDKFYTYRGSLTTPPCAEVVTWFVFDQVIPVSNVVLERFRWVYDERKLPVQNNVRPLQARNHRKVYYRN